MSDLVEFLKARVDENERAARAVIPADLPDGGVWIHDGYCNISGPGFMIYNEGGHDEKQSDHIATYDPARVLREVKAKRRIMARHARDPQWASLATMRDACMGCGVEGPNEWPVTESLNECPELRDLALVYADHPDYQQQWTP